MSLCHISDGFNHQLEQISESFKPIAVTNFISLYTFHVKEKVTARIPQVKIKLFGLVAPMIQAQLQLQEFSGPLRGGA